MNSVLRVFLGTAVLAGTSFAQVQVDSNARSDAQFDLRTTKVQDATSKLVSITHQRTGKTYQVNNQNGTRGARVAAYDNLSNPDGDPNGPLNFFYSRSDGRALCVYPLDPNDIFFTGVFAQGDIACADPNTAGFDGPSFPSVGIVDALEILWDDYTMDGTLVDPNQITEVKQIDFTFLNLQGTFGTPQSSNYILQYNLGFFENADFDADGTFEQLDGVVLNFLFDGNDGGGLFTASIDIEAAFGANTPGFFAYGDGLLLNDFTNVFFDEATGATPIAFACGVGDAFAGGGLPSSDPNCTAPEDLITAGTNASGVWIFATDTQGDPNTAAPWDPNFPIDLGADGDPNTFTYTDILNSGLLINIGYFDADTGRDINSAVPRRFLINDDVPPPLCGAGCEVPGGCADTNNDGAVDLTDLANVLANFGGGASIGDTNGDGSTDLTDLANILALFGTACP